MPSARPALQDIQAIATPLCREAWARELGDHPDKTYAAFIVRGIQNGFRIGFDYSSNSCIYECWTQHEFGEIPPQQIQEYIEREVAAGRVISSLLDTTAVQISRFGVIPKPHQPGKWRLITDLSSPEGASVNDGIDPQFCSVPYPSVDEAVATVLRLGKGTLLEKFDLESAYRMVPVHPIDRPTARNEAEGRNVRRRNAFFRAPFCAETLHGCGGYGSCGGTTCATPCTTLTIFSYLPLHAKTSVR